MAHLMIRIKAQAVVQRIPYFLSGLFVVFKQLDDKPIAQLVRKSIQGDAVHVCLPADFFDVRRKLVMWYGSGMLD